MNKSADRSAWVEHIHVIGFFSSIYHGAHEKGQQKLWGGWGWAVDFWFHLSWTSLWTKNTTGATEPGSSPWDSCLANYVATSSNLTPRYLRVDEGQLGGGYISNIKAQYVSIYPGEWWIFGSPPAVAGCDLLVSRWGCSSSFCDSPTCAGIYGETHWWAGEPSRIGKWRLNFFGGELVL